MVTGKSCDLLDQICLVTNIWSPTWRSYRDSVIVDSKLATDLVQQIQDLLVGVVDSHQLRSKSKRQLNLNLWKVSPVARANAIELPAGKFNQKLCHTSRRNRTNFRINSTLEALGCFRWEFVSASGARN